MRSVAGVRTSVLLDEELYTRLMHAAVDSRCSVSELVERAVRRGLEEGWLPGERCARRRRGKEGAGAAP
ncbi:MAG: ribbon-helix-helix protein, CopG family [Nitrososphaeria archaeon]